MTIVWTIGDIIGVTIALAALVLFATWFLIALIADWFRKPPDSHP